MKLLDVQLSKVAAEGFSGFNHKDQSVYQAFQSFDPQSQREQDLLEHGSDDLKDPAFSDWCKPARLKNKFGSALLGVHFLKEIHDSESEDSIEKQIHAAIYLTEKQEFNRHDRLMVDVTKDGRRKGGTHALPPELRRTRSEKIVNEQLLRWNCSKEECLEAEEFNAAVAERINRKREYALSQYQGKYRDVLSLFLLGLATKEVAARVGKTPRRIRQIVNGNAGRNAPGLRQFIAELCEQSPPLIDISASAPIVAVVGVRHAC